MAFVEQGNGTSSWLRRLDFTNERSYLENQLAGIPAFKPSSVQEMPIPPGSVWQRDRRLGIGAEYKGGDEVKSLDSSLSFFFLVNSWKACSHCDPIQPSRVLSSSFFWANLT
jgi:hypothetical protein